MKKMTNVSNMSWVAPITDVRRISNCMCGNDDIKVIHGGEHSKIYCEICGRNTVGNKSLNDMMAEWNNICKEGDRQ